MAKQDLSDLLALLDNSVSIDDGKVTVKDAARLRATIHRLAEVSALESGAARGWRASWCARSPRKLASYRLRSTNCIWRVAKARYRTPSPSRR